MKFATLFKSSDTAPAAPWPWPACVNNPKTLSFRLKPNSNIYKTMNSAYLHEKTSPEIFPETPDSFFSIPDPIQDKNESAVIGGIRSDRLFFEPGETNSILEEAKSHDKETVNIMAIDSHDPFIDFRASMEEMVEAHNLKEWECLEELLTCYLKVNSRTNHGYIVEAFVDLLINLALANNCSAIDEQCSSSSTTHYSFTSPLSFSSSSCTYSSTSPSRMRLNIRGGYWKFDEEICSIV